MRLLVWLLGALQILAGFQLATYTHDGWRWAWIAAGVTWILLGAGLALAAAVRAAMRRGLGSLRVPTMPTKGDK